MSRAVMQQALEALELLCPMQPHTQAIRDAAIIALKQAVAEPEPVAWVELTDEEQLELARDSMGRSRHWLVAQVEAKLKEKNSAPTPRKPLTDEQIVQVLGDVRESITGNVFLAFARAIEHAHGITGEQK